MITSTIGKIFLTAYNEKYGCNYDARTFFDEIYFPLFFDSNKYMQWVQNSPFVQMKKGQKVEILSSEERLEKLEILHEKIENGAVDASVAIGYAASEKKEFATTSGQVTNMALSISKDEVYLSWIGSSLGIGLQGGISILFTEPQILMSIFEGWKVYRQLLAANENLKGNQISTWNGQWISHRYGADYEEKRPMANFDPFETKENEMSIKTQSWTKVLLSVSACFQRIQLMGYVYNFGQTNTTIGFIPFILPEIRRPRELYLKLFGQIGSKEAETLWGTAHGLKICCQSGAIGIKAMEPKGVQLFMEDAVVPTSKNIEKNKITYQTYIIWILAMLNNEDLWDLSQDFAKILQDYIQQDEKKLNKQKTNQVANLLESKTKRGFIEALTPIVMSANDKAAISMIAKEINLMPTENVPYFLTLIRYQYAAIN